MGSFHPELEVKPIYQKIMKIASVFTCITIALVNGKPQFGPGFGPGGPGFGPGGPGFGPGGPGGPGPFGPGPLTYALPVVAVCPEEVCTACEEEGSTDIKSILEINCKEDLEDCHAAAKECSANAEDCYEPLKDCTCHIDHLDDDCTKECLIGPGPCLRENEITVGKCVAELQEEIAKCVLEQNTKVAKCVKDKSVSMAKAEECLACAAGCKKEEETITEEK